MRVVQTYSRLEMCPKQLMKNQPAPNLILSRSLTHEELSEEPVSKQPGTVGVGMEGEGWEERGLLSMPRALPGMALFNDRFTEIQLN